MNAGDIDAVLLFSFYSLTHYILENVSSINGMVLSVMFCRSVFVLSSFFFWPLCCLSFFDLLSSKFC